MKIFIAIVLFISLLKLFFWAYEKENKELKPASLFWCIIYSLIPSLIIIFCF